MQIVLIQQLQLVLVTVFHVPGRAWMDREGEGGKQRAKNTLELFVCACVGVVPETE